MEHIFRLFSDYPAGSLENSNWFADVFETRFTGLKTATVVVTHKRFPRKWQSRSEVTLVWSWGSRNKMFCTSITCLHSVCWRLSHTLEVLTVWWDPELQTNVTSLLVCHFRGNLLWVTTSVTVLSHVELVSNTSANQLLFSKLLAG